MIKYYKLLDLLNRRSMTKEELRQQIGISSATMSKISAHKRFAVLLIASPEILLNMFLLLTKTMKSHKAMVAYG